MSRNLTQHVCLKRLAAVVLLCAPAVHAGAAEKQAAKRTVAVCMNPGGNAAAVFWAEAVASQMFARIGVKLEWRNDPRSCLPPVRGIVITLARNTPADHHPGAMAYALPYERTHIVVFHDRVQAAAVASLLPHVLAHEITHMLRCSTVHSETGIMKQNWDPRDYVQMQRKPLEFTPDDVTFIYRGLDERASWASL